MSNVRRATTGGRRAAFVIVLHSMWRRAEGKFALIVLALWLLIAIVSLFWTPQSLWATDGSVSYTHLTLPTILLV